MKIIKRTTIVLFVFTIINIVGCLTSIFVQNEWEWKKIDIELVSKRRVEKIIIANDTSIGSLMSIYSSLDDLEDKESWCCVEIHTEQQWEELIELWEIDTTTCSLEFPGYYIISAGWEVESMQYKRINTEENKVSYGMIEKRGDYQPGTIFVYKLGDSVLLEYIETQ